MSEMSNQSLHDETDRYEFFQRKINKEVPAFYTARDLSYR